jgi:phosphatidate cytidylyltransferase
VRERSISAIGIVLIGITPLFFGGPVWAIAVAVFTCIGLSEYYRIAGALGIHPILIGYLAVPLAALLGLADWPADLALIPVGIGFLAAAILTLRRHNAEGSFLSLMSETCGIAYLAVPAYLAVATRGLPGSISAGWLNSTADKLSLGWDADPRGLAWMGLIITVTWLSDTGAYLVGRSIGKTPMVPAISPKKTREGLAGGVLAGMLFGILANWLFGLDLPILAAAGVAAILVFAGVCGDLTESLMKRQANVKDSGNLIPGHGGMLDRIDALLFTWAVGYFLARFCDRIWL